MATPPGEIILAAQAAERKWKIPASISLAQWAIESGWGKHMPPGSNNPFGMKARPSDPFVSVKTKEQDRHGREYTILAPFRKFPSLAVAFDEHAKLLATANVYGHAREKLPDVFAFADALTGVYATDRNYGKALAAVIHGSHLYMYDGISDGA